jgi:hypothetical protein
LVANRKRKWSPERRFEKRDFGATAKALGGQNPLFVKAMGAHSAPSSRPGRPALENRVFKERMAFEPAVIITDLAYSINGALHK